MSDVASLIIGPSFTSKGTKYLHLFNISLCGHEVTLFISSTVQLTTLKLVEINYVLIKNTSLKAELTVFLCFSFIIFPKI